VLISFVCQIVHRYSNKGTNTLVTDARADISGNCGAGIRADGFIIAEKSQYVMEQLQ
jgi:hypothetical protein